MAKVKVTPANGNIFADLGFAPDEANNLLVRAQLLNEVQRVYKRAKVTQSAGAKLFGVSQPRLNLALKGRIGEFSVDALINMLARAGRRVDVTIKSAQRAA